MPDELYAKSSKVLHHTQCTSACLCTLSLIDCYSICQSPHLVTSELSGVQCFQHTGVLQGTIALDGIHLQYGTAGQRQFLRKCGFVDQFPYLPEALTVEESLTLQYYFLHARHPAEAQAVSQMASVVTSTLEQVCDEQCKLVNSGWFHMWSILSLLCSAK